LHLVIRKWLAPYELQDRYLAPGKRMAQRGSDHAGAAAQDYVLLIGCRLHLQSMDRARQSRLLPGLLVGV
jgi:hypothetical protein